MLTVILIMGAGMLIGAGIKNYSPKQEWFFKAVDTLIPYAVWLLLFLLGVSVGSNTIVVHNLASLGFLALAAALAATVCSIALAVLVTKLFFAHES